MADITVKIGGMSCQHCVMRVKKAVDAIPGVSSSQVEIGTAKVSYDDSKTTPTAIKDAITKAGYTVTG
jgi:copper chaperone